MEEEKREQEKLINMLIDMFSSNNIELRKVKRELRKKFKINISLKKLTKMKRAQEEKREEAKQTKEDTDDEDRETQ